MTVNKRDVKRGQNFSRQKTDAKCLQVKTTTKGKPILPAELQK